MSGPHVAQEEQQQPATGAPVQRKFILIYFHVYGRTGAAPGREGAEEGFQEGMPVHADRDARGHLWRATSTDAPGLALGRDVAHQPPPRDSRLLHAREVGLLTRCNLTSTFRNLALNTQHLRKTH